MDIQEILHQKIKELPIGPYGDGLGAVRSHIDAAVRHFLRGQNEPDETLFTDVIFRCNQAFEGSIKEAYRVIARRDPRSVKPYDIEQFLEKSGLLRKKVLDQFTVYRREWRNASAHDYTLDFDEDEALLAIVTVTAFAIVLTDQIGGQIAFDDAAAAAPTHALSVTEQSMPLLELVTNKAVAFAENHIDAVGSTHSPAHDYYRLEGALAGYLSSELAALPGIVVEQNKRFASSEADIVVGRHAERVVIELKRTSEKTGKTSVRSVAHRGVTQVALYLHEADVIGAVVLVYSMLGGKYSITPASGALSDVVRIVAPQP